MENIQNGSGRFGRYDQNLNAMRGNIDPSNLKTDVVVVCSPTRMSDKVSYVWDIENETPVQHTFDQQVTTRISALLKSVNAEQHVQDIFGQNSGVPVGIAARVGTKECDAKILTYTVNKGCANVHGLLSTALHSAASAGTLESTMNEHGIFAIICVDHAKSVKLIQALENDLAHSIDTLIPFSKVPDDTLYELTVNEKQLPANPMIVFSGIRASFIITNGRSEMFATASEETHMSLSKEQAFEQAIATAMEHGIPTAGRTLEEIQADINEALSLNSEEFEEDGNESDEDQSYTDYMIATLLSFNYPTHTYRALAKSYDLPAVKAMERNEIMSMLADYFEENESDLIDVLSDLAPLAEARGQQIGTLTLTIKQLQAAAEADVEIEEDADEASETTLNEVFSQEALDIPAEERIEALQAAGVDTDGMNTVQVIRKYNEIREGLLGQSEEAEVESEVEIDLTDEEEAEESEATAVDILNCLPESVQVDIYNRFNAETAEEVVESMTTVEAQAIADQYEAEFNLSDYGDDEDPEAIAYDLFLELESVFEDASDDEEEDEDDSEVEETPAAAAENAIRATLALFGVEQLRGLSAYFDIEDTDDEENEAEYLIDSIIEELSVTGIVEMVEDLGLAEATDLEDFKDAIDSIENDDDEGFTTCLFEFAENVFDAIEETDDTEIEAEFNDDAVIAGEEQSPMGALIRVRSSGAAIVNFVLVNDEEFTEENVVQMSDLNGINYRFPFFLGEDGVVGSMHAPANVLLRAVAGSTQPVALMDRTQFNPRAYARRLADLVNTDIQSGLYAGQLEEDLDPNVYGIQLGDFDDEETEGTMIPMADLFTASAFTRVLNDGAASQLITSGVLNILVPGFFHIKNTEQVSAMLLKAVNTVTSTLADRTNLEVHAAFTFNIGEVMQSDHLFEALSSLREMENATIFTATDASAVDTTSNVLGYLAALDRVNLPMTVLTSGAGSYFFEQGGDTSVVIPCFELDEDEEDEEDTDLYVEEYEEADEDESDEDEETEIDEDDSDEDEDESEEDGDDEETEDESDEDESDDDVEIEDEAEDEDEIFTPKTAEEFIDMYTDDIVETDLSEMPRAEMRKAVLELHLVENQREAKALKGRELRELLESLLVEDEEDEEE